MKKALYIAAGLALLSAPVFAQGESGSPGGEGVARQRSRGDATGMGQRSGTAAPETMGAGAAGSRMAMPSRGKKMMRHKRSSKKMTRSRRMRGM